ncbi:MAG: transposase [Armatimonadetes bacterium]|nr:transposase [Armatimonadota bacterium]
MDALTQKVREHGRIVNVSVVVATAVNAEGKREILGMDVGTSEDGAFWLAFLRSLMGRGLSGVDLVNSDARHGLKDAIATVFAGASWQRCRTHFMTNLLSKVPKRAQALGGDHGAHHLPAAIPGRGPRTAPAHGGHARRALLPGRRAAGRGGAGHPRLHRLPHDPLEAGVVQQSAGAVEQGDPTAHRRGGHLPESCCRPASHRGGVGRAARRMAGRPALSRRPCPGRGDRGTHGGPDAAARRGSLIRPRGWRCYTT